MDIIVGTCLLSLWCVLLARIDDYGSVETLTVAISSDTDSGSASVSTINDGILERTESFVISVVSGMSGFFSISGGGISVNIIDNTGKHIVTVSVAMASVQCAVCVCGPAVRLHPGSVSAPMHANHQQCSSN